MSDSVVPVAVHTSADPLLGLARPSPIGQIRHRNTEITVRQHGSPPSALTTRSGSALLRSVLGSKPARQRDRRGARRVRNRRVPDALRRTSGTTLVANPPTTEPDRTRSPGTTCVLGRRFPRQPNHLQTGTSSTRYFARESPRLLDKIGELDLCSGCRRVHGTGSGAQAADENGHRTGVVVETAGIEPATPCLQSRCSSQLSYVPGLGKSSG